MAQYSNLKAYIEEKIYENGTQAITGDILQDVLKVMTDDLGEFYQMGGVASPSTDPGTPDAKVIYFATEAGTYTNFGGITLAAGEVALLIFETRWTKVELNVLSSANGGVKTANLADGAVTTEKIAGGAVETAKIANSAVTSGKVADGAIGTAKIADGAIDADKIAANAVESAKIKNGAVTEGKINDGAVTADKVAANAVTTAKIADDAVTTAKLNDGAVTEDKIATDAVTSGKVKDGAIGTAKIAAGAVTHAKIGAGAVEESNIKDGAVTSDKIANGAVGSDQLAEGAFSAENLADGSVTTDKLADEAVTAEKIADGAVTAGKFANGSVTTIKLGSGAVTTEKIGDGMVTRQKLADSSVSTSKIIDGAVTTDKVADGAITDAKLENPVSVSQNTITIGGEYAGEVSTTYDVTLHSGETFESLGDLLSDEDLATLIPANVRKGGMTIKFVQTTDNNYVQARCMAQSFSTSEADWQEENVYAKNRLEDNDFAISDEENNAIVKFSGGHIQTKNFDSRNIQTDNTDADFGVLDENHYAIVKFENGHIKTKNFDSSKTQGTVNKKELVHFIVLGQSLSVGYNSKPVLPAIDVKNAYMFSHVRTFDVGYNQNISRATYNPSQETYDAQFYQIRQLKEEADFGYNATKWIPFSGAEGETVCSGIAEMLEKLYKEQGYNGIPFSSIFTVGGVGATIIEMFGDGQTGCFNGHSSDIYERFKKDVRHAQKYSSELGFSYHPIMVWMQGEGNLTISGFPDRTFEYCKQTYENLHTVYDNYLKSVGVKDDLQLFLYQTDEYRYQQNPNNPLAQFDIALKKDWAHLTYPVYNLQKVTPNDYIHLTSLSERLYGNCIGSVVFDYLNKGDILFKIIRVIKDGNTLYVHFNKQVTVDLVNMNNLNSGAYSQWWITEITRTLGFFPVDANGDIALNTSEGSVVDGQVTLTNDNVIKIVCSTTPVKLMYGYRDDNTAQMSTTGGAIRVDDELVGYNENNIYRYLPQQLIETFETIFDFSYSPA